MEVAVLKKFLTVLGVFFAAILACPLSVFAAEGSEAAATVPVWLCIPFAGLLLCIAVMPLVKAEWWESHQPLVVAIWIILVVVSFALVYGAGKTAETVLECIVNDYLTFIILLFGLFCVSGNITMEGDFAGSPRVNVGLLALGTLLASCIGTTGASMLMVRPVIKMNSWRKRKGHIMIFFIFMVSNMGGCLTPIGDPPLLMGFMRGVPFFWSLHLFPVLIFNMVILLFVFYQIDKRSYRKDIANGRKPDIRKPGTQFRLDGLHNIIFLVMIVGAVILSGVLPGMSAFQDAAGNVRGIHLFGEVTLTFPALIEIVIILLAALSYIKYNITSGMIAPITPIRRPSNTNGARTKPSFAPMYFMIAISSRLTVIPIVTVLLIRKIETASRIKIIAAEMIPTSLFTLVRVLATVSDLLTFRTPSSFSA